MVMPICHALRGDAEGETDQETGHLSVSSRTILVGRVPPTAGLISGSPVEDDALALFDSSRGSFSLVYQQINSNLPLQPALVWAQDRT